MNFDASEIVPKWSEDFLDLFTNYNITSKDIHEALKNQMGKSKGYGKKVHDSLKANLTQAGPFEMNLTTETLEGLKQEADILALKMQFLFPNKGFVPFGTLVANYAPLLLNGYGRADVKDKSYMKDKSFKPESDEMILEALLVNLTQSLGFDNDWPVSALTIPGVMGDMDILRLFKNPDRRSLPLMKFAMDNDTIDDTLKE